MAGYWIHDTAVVIGRVELGDDVSVWPTAVIRGDVERIVIGARSNVQDGALIHADPGKPTIVGEDVVIGRRSLREDLFGQFRGRLHALPRSNFRRDVEPRHAKMLAAFSQQRHVRLDFRCRDQLRCAQDVQEALRVVEESRGPRELVRQQ